MAVLNPFDFFLEPYAETYPFAYEGAEKRDLAPYLVMFRGEPLFRNTWQRSRASASAPSTSWWSSTQTRARHQVPDPHGAGRADARAHADVRMRFVPRLRLVAGAAAAPPRPRGALRLRLSDPADARREVARRPVGARADFTDLHAWCEVYLPGAGWIGLDPTSGLLAGEGHIPLACTPRAHRRRAGHRRRGPGRGRSSSTT